MWLSDIKDEFLKAFTEEWISWDGGLQKSRTGHDDTLDAVYWLGEISLGHIMQEVRAGQEVNREKQKSPMSGLGSYKGYG
jgi:hypothetical protein